MTVSAFLRPGSGDREACHAIWEACEQELWQDATRMLSYDWFDGGFECKERAAQEGLTEEGVLASRMHFLVDDATGERIGTTTAWWGANNSKLVTAFFSAFAALHWSDCCSSPSLTVPFTNAVGVVHYVGMLPQYGGRGLSRPLMVAVLRQMKALGHTASTLGTSTGRWAAVNLYARLGFQPEIAEGPAAATEYRAWRELQPILRAKINYVPAPRL